MRLLSYCRGFANVNHHRTDPCSGTAYTLAFAGLLLLGGRLADRFGARRTLALGVVGFAAASAVGGAAPDGAMLIAARAVQGAFAAVLVSSTKSLLVTVYTDERERARAMSVFGATFCSLAMVGLVYGLGEVTATGWGSAQVIGSLVVAGVAGVAFVTRQARLPHGLRKE